MPSWRCSTSGPLTPTKFWRQGGRQPILQALLDLLVSSAPPGTTLGEALVAGYVGVTEVVDVIRGDRSLGAVGLAPSCDAPVG
jgi:hypothetical protein